MRDFWAGARPVVGRRDVAYPIILGHDGRVMDGMHRIARALLDGRAEIDPPSGSRRRSSRTIDAACRTSCRTDCFSTSPQAERQPGRDKPANAVCKRGDADAQAGIRPAARHCCARPLLGRRCRARGLRSARNAQRTPKGSTGACSLIDRHGAGARDPHAHPRRRSARDSPFLQGLKSLASSLHHDDHALAFVPLKRSSQDVRGVIGTTGE